MVGEKPREEIMVSPEWDILMFGDGYIALLQGAKKYVDDEGNVIVEMVIKPSPLLRKRYDIKESQTDKNGNQIIRINQDDLIPINIHDDANRKWVCIKTYDGNDTEISNIGWDLRKRNKMLSRKVVYLEGEVIYWCEQAVLAKTNPAEFITQAADVLKKLSESFEPFLNKKDKLNE